MLLKLYSPRVCMCGQEPQKPSLDQNQQAWSLPVHWWEGSGALGLDGGLCESGRRPDLVAAGKDNSEKQNFDLHSILIITLFSHK